MFGYCDMWRARCTSPGWGNVLMISRQFERAEDDEDEEPDPSAARGEVRGEVRGEDREGGGERGGGVRAGKN